MSWEDPSAHLPLLQDEESGVELVEVPVPHRFTARVYQAPLVEAFTPPDLVSAYVEKPEEEQDPLDLRGAVRRAVCVWHRRAGKDKTVINIVLGEALKRVGYYLYLFPKQVSVRKAIWKGRDQSGMRFLDHFPAELIANINNTEMAVELINGSIIQCAGSDNFDNLMGTNPLGIVFSEWSISDPRALDYLRPILRENDGWALFIYTARGHNHGWSLRNRARLLAKSDPRWFFAELTVLDTVDEHGNRIVTDEDLEEEREEGMSEEMIQQEYFCSFEAYNEGTYFGKQMKRARQEGRVGVVPVEPMLPVHTFWDLGINDTNAIWFVQAINKEIRLVHYYGNYDEGMPHYFRYIKEWAEQRDVQLGQHYAPHDIKVREYSDGLARDRWTIAKQDHGWTFQTVPRPASLTQHGGAIEAARGILPRCYFDEKQCGRGLEGLVDYGKKWDDDRKMFKNQPDHNWASHPASAFMVLAQAWRDSLAKKKKPPRTAIAKVYDPLA